VADLDRFVAAQDGIYATALAEIRAGAKRSHWMWFVFPQLTGLGHSAMARAYAIGSLDEARAYLADPLLGERLRACVRAIPDGDPERMFGGIDAVKLRSSLTLFAAAGGADEPFGAAIDRLFDGQADATTLRMIDESV